MGRLSTTGGGRLGGGGGGPDLTTATGLLQLAEQKGLGKEARGIIETPKISLFQRLGRGLTAFETGNALYQSRYEKKSFAKTYVSDIFKDVKTAVTGRESRETPKNTFKDVLTQEGFKDRPGKLDMVDVLGLAGDILTDPTTFFGGFVGKAAFRGTRVGLRAAEKIPVAGKVAKGLREAGEDLFVPFAGIKRQLGEKGEQYVSAFQKYVKGTRSEMDDFLGSVAEKAKAVKGVPEAGRRIGEAVETGVKTGDKLVDEVMSDLVATQNRMSQQELKRGLYNTQLPNYMHHMLTPKAAEYLTSGGNLSQFVKPIRVRLGAAKHRKIEGIVTEINKEYNKRLGFNLFEEDAFKAFGKRGLDSIRAINTHDFLQRVKIQFGKQADKNFIDDVGVRWIESKAPQLKGFRVPESIAKHIDETNKILTNDEATNGLLKLFDKVQTFWKGSVTGYFPAFHTRNAMGGMFNNWIAGIRNPEVYISAEKVLRGGFGEITTKAGQKVSYDQIRTWLKEYGVINQTGYLDIGDVLRREVAGGKVRGVTNLPHKVMSYVENRLRTPLFVDGLQKGMTAEQAAKRVIKFHFDYMPEGFTPFEKNIMKRIIPFYTWTRHNVPLQLEQMIQQPGKYAGIFKTQRAWGVQPSSEEEEVLPRWLKERFTIKGEGGYWSGIGLPVEEATEKLSAPLRGFGISLSPFIKVPIEQLTGYNIFKEKRINEDVYAKYYRNAPQQIKDWLELKETTSKTGEKFYTVNPRKKYWLEVTLTRGLSTALRVADYADDKKNVLSLITTIKKYNYDINDLKRWSDADKRRELESLLERAGILGKFEVPFKK